MACDIWKTRLTHPLLLVLLTFSVAASTADEIRNGFRLSNALVPAEQIFSGGPAREGLLVCLVCLSSRYGRVCGRMNQAKTVCGVFLKSFARVSMVRRMTSLNTLSLWLLTIIGIFARSASDRR